MLGLPFSFCVRQELSCSAIIFQSAQIVENVGAMLVLARRVQCLQCNGMCDCNDNVVNSGAEDPSCLCNCTHMRQVTHALHEQRLYAVDIQMCVLQMSEYCHSHDGA